MLAAFGVQNFTFAFRGDILFIYAVLGGLLVVAVRLPRQLLGRTAPLLPLSPPGAKPGRIRSGPNLLLHLGVIQDGDEANPAEDVPEKGGNEKAESVVCPAKRKLRPALAACPGRSERLPPRRGSARTRWPPPI